MIGVVPFHAQVAIRTHRVIHYVAAALQHFILLGQVFLQNVDTCVDVLGIVQCLSGQYAESLVVESQLILFYQLHTPQILFVKHVAMG